MKRKEARYTATHHPCILCGRSTPLNRLMVNFDNATGECIPLDGPADPVRREEGRDYGLQVIGSDCAKKLPKTWIVDCRKDVAA